MFYEVILKRSTIDALAADALSRGLVFVDTTRDLGDGTVVAELSTQIMEDIFHDAQQLECDIETAILHRVYGPDVLREREED